MYCYCKWSVLEFPDMIMSTDGFWNQWNNLKDHGAVGQESWWWSCFQVNFFSSVMCWAVQSCMPHRNSKSILKQVIQLCDNFCSNICPYAFTTHIVKGSVQWTNNDGTVSLCLILENKGGLYGHCICIILINSTWYWSILHGLILNYW